MGWYGIRRCIAAYFLFFIFFWLHCLGHWPLPVCKLCIFNGPSLEAKAIGSFAELETNDNAASYPGSWSNYHIIKRWPAWWESPRLGPRPQDAQLPSEYVGCKFRSKPFLKLSFPHSLSLSPSLSFLHVSPHTPPPRWGDGDPVYIRARVSKRKNLLKENP